MNRRELIVAAGCGVLSACHPLVALRDEAECLRTPSPITNSQLLELGEIARASLEANLVDIDRKVYLAAGAHQFRSLWTRDFCWSVGALLELGRCDVVRRQLQQLLNNLGEHGVVPRTLDNRGQTGRVLVGAALRVRLPLGEPLKPEHLDQHGNVAIDGNALVVIATRAYVRATGDAAFWDCNRTRLQQAMRFYDHHRAPSGLIRQPPYSDWQDSLERAGETFYTNLLYSTALAAVADDGSFDVTSDTITAFRRLLDEAFFDASTGLYVSQKSVPSFALDGNLLAIELGHTTSPDRVYAALKKHPLWTDPSGPGFVTTDEFSTRGKALQFWLNLRDYHTSLYWSWLMALSAKTALRMGDTNAAGAILAELLRMGRRDGSIAEIYAHSCNHPLVRRLAYTSEAPFSWGAATVLDAVLFARARETTTATFPNEP